MIDSDPMLLNRFSSIARRKLETYCYSHDHFIGYQYDNDFWFARGSTGYSVVVVSGGVIRVRTGTASGRYSEIYQNDLGDYSIAGYGRCLIRATVSGTATIASEFGFKAASPDAGTDWIRFIFDTNTSPNWYTDTTAASTSTTNNTGIAADTNYHEFEIVTRPSEVLFFIDGVLVATHTTNLSTKLFQLYARATTRAAAARDTLVDFFDATGNREAA